MGLSFSAILGTIVIIIDIITNVMIITTNIPKIKVLVFGFSILVVHYFLFVHKNKYKKIEDEFRNGSKEERKRKGSWVLLYAFGSVGLFIFLMFFGIWVKHG